MKRNPFDPRMPRSGRGSPNDRLEQAKAARQSLLAQHAAKPPAAPPKSVEVAAPIAVLPSRDQTAHLKALEAIPFWQPGEQSALHVSGVYRALAETALKAMHDKSRVAVLCWPDCAPSPSALSVLLTLADCAAAPTLQVGNLEGLAEPFGFRSLVYPYASTAHRSIRHVYADKKHVGHINTLHQVRTTRPGEDDGFSDFHKALARSKTLTGLALDGNTYDEFRHPCLDELMPFGPCTGNEGRQGLLWRVSRKTDLKLISRSGAADNPSSGRFYLFGLRPKDPIVPALKAMARRLDIIFLDLSSAGRARLGRDWLPKVREFLEQAEARLGPVATVALTDDPWSFDALRFEGLIKGPLRKAKGSAQSRVVFAPHPDIVTSSESSPQEYTEVKRHEVVGFSGEVEGLLQALRANARKAEAIGDRIAADLLWQLLGTIRRCSGLPASRDSLSAYLEEEVGGLGAADQLVSYRVTPAMKELKASTGSWAQLHGKDRTALLAQVERVWGNTGELTPMAPMLHDTIKKFLRASSSTAVLFRRDMLADFAAHALSNDDEIGEVVQTRLEKEMFYFLDESALDDLAQMPTKKRNYMKTLIVVAPTRAQLMKILARPWLPENLIVLGDSDTLRSAASDARRLAGHKELGPIATRLLGFATRADGVVHRPTGVPAEEPFDDADFSGSSVVNLAGKVRADQTVIRFRLSGEQVVVARPGTKLILQDNSRTVPTFIECDAKDVDVGDNICVIGDAFLEAARPLLNIAVRAAEEIRDYHSLVLERLGRLPGSTDMEKLSSAVRDMAMPDVTVQRASYWIDLEAQKDAPLHEVVPHAPRDRATFLSFMRALGVSESIALHFWTWAVIAQRSSRLRAAASFHDAYRSILTDNYSMQSSDPQRSRELRRLKASAEDFVSSVVEKKNQRGEDAAV